MSTFVVKKGRFYKVDNGKLKRISERLFVDGTSNAKMIENSGEQITYLIW